MNIKKLSAAYKLTMADVVEEVVYALDTKTALDVRKKIGKEVYSDATRIASTLIEVVSLALPDQLVEIKIVAKAR